MDVTESQEMALGKAAYASVLESYHNRLLPYNHKVRSALLYIYLCTTDNIMTVCESCS